MPFAFFAPNLNVLIFKPMSQRHKILLLDDEQDLLDLFQEVLRQLPSQPEIHTATSGRRVRDGDAGARPYQGDVDGRHRYLRG